MRGKQVLKMFTEIINDLQNQDLETITELLNYYNGKPVEIDGATYHPYNDPITAAKINERYNELTGENHPTFVRESPKLIEGLLEDKDMLLEAEAYPKEYFEKLEELQSNLTSKETIKEEPAEEKPVKEEPAKEEPSDGNSQHILVRMGNIVNDLKNANLEDVSQLLDYYNGKPVEIDGATYHPYNDPITAAKINERYNELTGENHPTFVRESPKLIEGLLEDKDMLLEAEAYPKEYFEKLEEIRENLSSHSDKGINREEQTNKITRQDILDTIENVKISEINNDTIELKQEVRAEEQPTIDRDDEERN